MKIGVPSGFGDRVQTMQSSDGLLENHGFSRVFREDLPSMRQAGHSPMKGMTGLFAQQPSDRASKRLLDRVRSAEDLARIVDSGLHVLVVLGHVSDDVIILSDPEVLPV